MALIDLALKYEGLDKTDPIFLPYIKDSLKELNRIYWQTNYQINSIYSRFIFPIVDYLKSQKGEFKGLNSELENILLLAGERLAKDLQLLFYEGIKDTIFASNSPLARIKLDEFISLDLTENIEHFLEDKEKQNLKNPTSEIMKLMRPVGEEKKKENINYKIGLIQSHELKHAEAVARHALDGKRFYNNKEWTLSSRIWDISKAGVKNIKDIFSKTIFEDCNKTARFLERYQQVGSRTACREYPSMMKRLGGRVPPDLSFEAHRLARNENAERAFADCLERWKENEYVGAVQWLLSNNRNPKYERLCKCNDIAYEDRFGLGEGIYPKDEVPDRPHVMCLCNIAPISSRKLKKAIKAGLKLGNVPQDWWLEQKRKLQEVRRNSEDEKQYKLRFNSTLSIKNRAERLGITKENVPKTSYVDIQNDLKKIDNSFFELLNRCRERPIIDLNYKGTPYYDLKSNRINIHLFEQDPRSLQAGFNTNMTGLLHEMGHYLDYNLMNKKGVFLHNQIPHLRQTLELDALNYINRTYRQLLGKNAADFRSLAPNELKNGFQFYEKLGKMKGIPQLDKLVVDKLAKKIYINSAVSDILEGLTNGQIAGQKLGTYGHVNPYNLDYWETPYAVEGEAIAHLFEALGSRELRLQAIQEVFPTVWNDFITFFKF